MSFSEKFIETYEDVKEKAAERRTAIAAVLGLVVGSFLTYLVLA